MVRKKPSRVVITAAISLFVVAASLARVANAAPVFELRPYISGMAGIDGGMQFKCGGHAQLNPATNMQKVLVSYQCQWAQEGTSTWTSYPTSAPAYSCTNCSGTNRRFYTYFNVFCGAPFQAGKKYLFRARVDGYYIDNTGLRHDVSAINGSDTMKIDCTVTESPVHQLTALTSVYGSTASSGPTVACGGQHRTRPLVASSYTIAVSYVCQKNKVGTSTWTSIGTAPQQVWTGAAATDYHATTVNCTTLGSGTWNVRARVDGYWTSGPTRFDMNAIVGNSINVPC